MFDKYKIPSVDDAIKDLNDFAERELPIMRGKISIIPKEEYDELMEKATSPKPIRLTEETELEEAVERLKEVVLETKYCQNKITINDNGGYTIHNPLSSVQRCGSNHMRYTGPNLVDVIERFIEHVKRDRVRYLVDRSKYKYQLPKFAK